jgi:hypothetical protein
VPDSRRHGGTLLRLRSDDVAGFVEQVRGDGAVIAVEPYETDGGTLSAYFTGPPGILVAVKALLTPGSPAQ